MGEIVTRAVNLEIREEGKVVFRISDESVDSHGTVFKLDGWDLSEFRANPIVTYGHPDTSSTDPNVIIGRGEISQDSTGLYSTLEYDMENPLAKEVKRKIDSGFIRMASIRAYVEDARMGDESKGEDPSVLFFTKNRLLDWGVVMHASNKNASKRELVRAFNIEDKPIVPEVIEVDDATKQRIQKILQK